MHLERLSDKDPREVITISKGFAPLLQSGETISNPVVTAAVASGTDPNPSAILSGAPSISGSDVLQKITGGIDGVDYLITFKVNTNLGHVYVEAVILPAVTAD